MELTRLHSPGAALAWLRSRFVWLLLLAGMVLLFANLSDVYLWQDEAETAIIARHFLTYGLPLSTDGRDWVQQAPQMFREFNRDYIWIYHPWLQYLVTAASFAIFGMTTFAARLPFVLAGLATLLVLYRFVWRWLQDALSARVAGLLLLLCVPFIVLVRQCRYYSLSALFTLLTVDSYLWLRRAKPWAVPYFVLSAVLLFHSFYVAFFPTLAGLVAHMMLGGVALSLKLRGAPQGVRATNGARFKRSSMRFLFALLLVAFLTLPWTGLIPAWRAESEVPATTELSTQGPGTGGTAMAEPSAWAGILGGLGQYILYITLWIFPLVLGLAWLTVCGLSRLKSSGAQSRRPPWPGAVTRQAQESVEAWPSVPPLCPSPTSFCQIVGCVIAANIAALSVVGYAFFRYLTHLMPLLLALLAVAVAWLIKRWPVAGYALLFVLVTSNGLHIFPYMLFRAAVPQQSRLWSEMMTSPATDWVDQVATIRLRSDLLMYGQELTHSYQGPNEGLVAYLSKHATPDQTVLVNYEDLPLQFYTDLHVLGGFSAHGLTPDLRPDWVVDRKYGPYRDLLAEILAAGPYERITIPFPDIRWENREEARQHHYLTVQDEDPVTLYQRLGG
jgi:hypothetical protein